MTFLQPFILWGLPLVMVPVVIHLLNRMRYRSLDWAAMSFLLAATRRSRRSAKLRHWLVLLCRVLAVTALVLALARPLVGGWLGWAVSGAPETVILLVDRSPSMEWQEGTTTKRAAALRRLAEAARATGGSSRLVVIDSATRVPQEIADGGVLPELAVTSGADAAADVPGMLGAAVDYILANQCGRTELWLASDLQASDWQPESLRWAEVTARLGALPQDVRMRLLALPGSSGENWAVRVAAAQRQRSELLLTVDVARNDGSRGESAGEKSFPLAVVLEGARSLVNVKVTGSQLRWQQTVALGDGKAGGWGWVELPPDANGRDNVSYFAFGAETHLAAVIVADDPALGRLLSRAAAPAPAQLNQSSVAIKPSAVPGYDWQPVALLVAAARDDSGWMQEDGVRRFLDGGGVAVIFPSADGVTNTARVTSWRKDEGPLADAQGGVELAVNELAVTQRVVLPAGETVTVLASFADGQPFVTREPVGRGWVYRCATLPQPAWSDLAEGTVLVPMLQRMLREGGRRLGTAVNGVCGEDAGAAAGELWTQLNRNGGTTAGASSVAPVVAGVYQVGGRLVALNRPAAEDVREAVDETTVRGLFGSVPVRFFEEQAEASGNLSSEIWRVFVVAVLLFLIGEALLTLPGREGTR